MAQTGALGHRTSMQCCGACVGARVGVGVGVGVSQQGSVRKWRVIC